MDTQNTTAVEIPNFKLAKVGKDRERRRGGAAGWWGSGAGAGFDGAIGGAGAGGFLGTGMSLAKLLTVLLVSAGISAGAWKAGNMIASGANAKPAAAKKLFADKGAQYTDTSGVIKADHSIPNSLGYVNNDGLTDEQRAAKRAADAAAAKKAADDAQKLADEEAKKKAAADAQAAAAPPAPVAAPHRGFLAAKFGAFKSGLGGLSGGSGLSGGISRGFSAPTLPIANNKGTPNGPLSAFRSAAKIASSQTAMPRASVSSGKGAREQSMNANSMSHLAVGAGTNETAAAAAAKPFDNNPTQGNVISGPGMNDGAPASAAGAAGTPANTGGPVGDSSGCSDPSMAPDASGNCTSTTGSPTGRNAAPYQGLIMGVMLLLGIVAVLSVLKMKNVGFVSSWAKMAIAALGGIIAMMGMAIIAMSHDIMIGGIITAVGGFVTASALMNFTGPVGAFINSGAGSLIASAIGLLAGASKMMERWIKFMSKENDDVIIPDLKKKEKERKKAGAAWSGARGAGSEFTGATGGSGISRAAASAAGAFAEPAFLGAEALEEGGLWGTISRFFAEMTSTAMGRMAVGAAALMLIAGAGALGYELLKGGSQNGGGMGLNLGGIADSLRVREGGSDRLGVDSKGELRFDPLAATKPAAPPVADAKAAPAPAAAEPVADAGKDNGQGFLLAHNLSGAKLTSALGGEFGGKNIFAGSNSMAPKFNTGASNMTKLPSTPGGHLSAMRASAMHTTPTARSIGMGSTGRAFGQLRLARGLSMQGATAGTVEQAAGLSQGAFDQQQPAGGGLNTIGAPGGDDVIPPGEGAPDTSLPTAPGTPSAIAPIDSGLQNSISQIQSLIQQAEANIKMGIAMMALGALLIGIGIGLLFIPTYAMGIALIAAGTALLAMGVMKIMTGKSEAQQAISMGQNLGSSIDNMQQAAAVNYCTQQAVASGGSSSLSSCTPPSTETSNDGAWDGSAIQQVEATPGPTPTISH